MKVKYFAWVRERIGKSEETVEPPANARGPGLKVRQAKMPIMPMIMAAMTIMALRRMAAYAFTAMAARSIGRRRRGTPVAA